MILRASIVLLLMLNLGVAIWWWAGGDLRASTATDAGDKTQPGLRLVNEPVVATPVGRPPPAVSTATPVAILSSTPPKPVPPTVPATPTDSAVCLSFGPFDDAAARDAVRPRLQALAQKLVARETQARSARGWRVYMPPLASRDAAQGVVDSIKAAGINDLYIIATGDEANSIALGRYGGEESARRRQAQLAGKGFDARAESLGDTPPQWWLDARAVDGASRATLAAIAPSRPMDCARLP